MSLDRGRGELLNKYWNAHKIEYLQMFTWIELCVLLRNEYHYILLSKKNQVTDCYMWCDFTYICIDVCECIPAPEGGED